MTNIRDENLVGSGNYGIRELRHPGNTASGPAVHPGDRDHGSGTQADPSRFPYANEPWAKTALIELLLLRMAITRVQ